MTGTKNNLFELIKSLTKPERGYIKKFASRHSGKLQDKYIKLFDEVAKQAQKNEYSEITLKQKFKDKKFINNFSVAKSYVYNAVLRSLNSYYAHSNKDNELKEKIRSIEVLYRKALYAQCLNLLKRTKSEALRYDNFIQQLELIKWEINLIHEGAYPGKSLKNLERILKEEKEILAKIQNLIDYRTLSSRLHYSKTQKQQARAVKNLLKNPLLQSKDDALSYPAMINFHHIRAKIFRSAGELLKSYSESSKTVEIMEKYPEKIKEYSVNYLISLYNLIEICSTAKLYKEFDLYFNKLRSIPDNISKGMSVNMQVLMFIGPSMLKLNTICEKGDFESGKAEALQAQMGMEKFKNKINPLDELNCAYNIAYIYFGAGDYEKAFIWLSKILNVKTEDEDITGCAAMLNLIVHYELKNYELLEFLLKSTYRRLSKQKKRNELEQLFIVFLKKASAIFSAKELTELYEETKIRISELNKVKKTYYFDYESWLESKISGRKFADIVKEKHNRSSSRKS